MSEPQYNFCVIVIRERVAAGFELKHLCVAYAPGLPQEQKPRKAWLRKLSVINNIKHQLRSVFGDELLLDRETEALSRIGSLHLWAVVPMFRTTSSRVMSLVQYEKDHIMGEMRVLRDADINYMGHYVQGFFRKICAEFHQMGGGKWIVGQREHEVSRK